MEWVPIVFITFKVLALGTGMFFAIKWHYDRGGSTNPTGIIKVVLECAGYILAVLIVFALLYGLLHYLGLLPAGLDFESSYPTTVFERFTVAKSGEAIT